LVFLKGLEVFGRCSAAAVSVSFLLVGGFGAG